MTETAEKVTCMDCRMAFVPSFEFDFYPVGKDPRMGRCENCMMKNTFATPRPSPLPAGYEKTVCKPGRGEETCSFLGVSGGEHCCVKGSAVEEIIIARRADGSMFAKGDNCSGPPDFKVRSHN